MKFNGEDSQALYTPDIEQLTSTCTYLACETPGARPWSPFEGVLYRKVHDDTMLGKISAIYCTVLGCSQPAEENEAQNGPRYGKKPETIRSS